jgi:hypothetical protein
MAIAMNESKADTIVQIRDFLTGAAAATLYSPAALLFRHRDQAIWRSLPEQGSTRRGVLAALYWVCATTSVGHVASF